MSDPLDPSLADSRARGLAVGHYDAERPAMTADPHIEAEGDKPKVEKTRHHFAALIAGLKTSQEYAADIFHEYHALAARLEAAERDLADARAENERLREYLDDVHEFQCGCDRPGHPDCCVAVPEGTFAALAAAQEPPADGGDRG